MVGKAYEWLVSHSATWKFSEGRRGEDGILSRVLRRYDINLD